MVILGQPPLLQKGLNLLRSEAVAVLHGRLAGDHVEQFVEDIAGFGGFSPSEQLLH